MLYSNFRLLTSLITYYLLRLMKMLQEDELIDWGAVKEQHEEATKARWAKCPTLIKNFYKEHPEVTELSQEQVKKFRLDNNNIAVSNFDPESAAPLLNPVSKYEISISLHKGKC